MKITMIGSGGWDGSPFPFSTGKEKRTRPEFFVEGTDGNFMVEISPDIRTQSKGLPKVFDFLVSHWHFDHLFGIFELDAYSLVEETIRVYCSKETADWINNNCSHFPITVTILTPYKEFSLHGIKITPIPVVHTKDKEGTFAFLFDDGKQRVAYLSDYYEISSESLTYLHKADVVIADGTYLFENKFDEKYTKLLDDKNHLHGNDIITFAKQFKNVIFHSISAHHGLSDAELHDLLPDTMSAGYDGCEITKSK